MLKKLRKLFYKYFDYRIVRTYLEFNGSCYTTRHIRKYYLKRRKHR